MNSTGITPASTVGGRQVDQVLAGRYRLAVSKGGDDIADVWHALDETTEQVVTLEILRDRDNEAARQRFLAEARRMAAIERPSVMRVAAIHDEGSDTFIVFEHLIPLPVVLTGLTGVAKDVRPATKAAEDEAKPIVITPSAPQGPVPVTPSAVLSAVVGPKRAADREELVDDAAPTIVDLDEAPAIVPQSAAMAPTVRLPESVEAASGPLGSARPSVSGLVDKLKPFGDDARLLVRDLGLETPVASARAFVSKLDTGPIAALVARVTALVASVTTRAANVTTRAGALVQNVTTGARATRQSVTTRAQAAMPSARQRPATSDRGAMSVARTATSVGAGVLSALAAVASGVVPIATSVAAAAAPRVARARGNPVVLAGATALVFLAVFVITPLDDMVADALRSGTASAPTAVPSGGLAPAPFEVPPLAAYGAAFDSQGAYPRTTPGGTVEWVVALRNTGSAGWYRGIEGAQAALALPDGTGVAVQSTQYVAPGQVGWFVVRFLARSEVGSYTVQLLPRIDGRGPLPDLGIYAVVTVARNP